MQVPSNTDEIWNAFFEGKRTKQIEFAYNDTVEILSGDQSGKFGSVVSMHLQQEPLLIVVELGETGLDVLVEQKNLRLILDVPNED